MKHAHFTALSAATLLCLTAAWATAPRMELASAGAGAGQAVFPDLGASARDLATLEVRAGEASIKAVKSPEGRFVEESSGHPMAEKALRALLHSMTLAEFAEPKTKDPARHAALNLSAEGAREVILQNGDGKMLAHLVVGKSDYTLGGAQGGQYLRRGGEDQAWLARARIELPSSRAGWFETELITRDAAEVTRVALTPRDGAEIAVERAGESLRMAAEPETTLEKSKADRLFRMAANLRFSDVRKSDPAQTPLVTASAEFGEEGRLSLSLIESTEAGHWLRLESTSADLIDPARLAGFDFLISAWSAEPLTWGREDLLERAEG